MKFIKDQVQKYLLIYVSAQIISLFLLQMLKTTSVVNPSEFSHNNQGRFLLMAESKCSSEKGKREDLWN